MARSLGFFGLMPKLQQASVGRHFVAVPALAELLEIVKSGLRLCC